MESAAQMLLPLTMRCGVCVDAGECSGADPCEAFVLPRPDRITLRTENLSELIADAGGLGFMTAVTPVRYGGSPLPPVVPMIEPRRGLIPRGAACVSLDRIRPLTGIRPAAEVRGALGMPARFPLLVNCHQYDTLIEAFWRAHSAITPKARRARYSVWLTPAFSMWSHLPTIHKRLQMRRSLTVWESFQRARIAATLPVAWDKVEDLKAWLELLAERPDIRMIGVDLITVGARSAWTRAAMPGIDLIAPQLVARELIVSGVSSTNHLRDLASAVPHFHLVTSAPHQAAVSRARGPSRQRVFDEELGHLSAIVRAAWAQCCGAFEASQNAAAS